MEKLEKLKEKMCKEFVEYVFICRKRYFDTIKIMLSELLYHG
jgi:hypothetical protein